MARGRKSESVKVLTGRDIKLLRQLDRTGVTASDQAKIYCGISTERLNKLEKSGYVKTKNMTVDGANTRIIQLDKTGDKFCKENYGTRYVYHTQDNHITHDLRLTEAYYNLPSHVQDTWKHESELVHEIYNKHPELKGNLKTCVDATVVVNNQIIAIESRGASYTQADIDIKQDIAVNLLHCQRMEVV